MEQIGDYLQEDGHLNDIASALVADALAHDQIPGVPGPVMDHVESCRDCKDKIMDVAVFMKTPGTESGDILTMPVKSAPPARKYWHVGKIAAVFAVFALMLGAYLVIQENPWLMQRDASELKSQNNQPQPIQDKNAQTAAKQEGPAAQKKTGKTNSTANKNRTARMKNYRYRINPNLESMIGSRLRSGRFEALTPGNNSVVELPIGFSWKNNLVDSHTLKIVNNRNRVLYRYTVTGNSFDFSDKLRPGLYYWKVESKNELLYVGKFFIGTPPQSALYAPGAPYSAVP